MVERGADVSARNAAGQTPLDQRLVHSGADEVRLLAAAGADVLARDELGRAAVHRALVNGDIWTDYDFARLPREPAVPNS